MKAIMRLLLPPAFMAAMALSAIQPQQAHAAGFYIQEQSVSGLGRSYAGVAAHPMDSSTVYYNPAGMPRLTGPEAQAGVSVLHPSVDFRDQGTVGSTTLTGGALVDIADTGDGGNPYNPAIAVPNLFIAHPFSGSKWWAGLAVTAPFGLSNEYQEGWFGRYDSTSSDLKVIDIAPSFAYKASDVLSLGAGVDIQYVDADLRRAIPDPLNAGGPTRETDGELVLEGDSWAVGFNAGLLYEPWKHTRVGMHYRSEVNHRLDGNLKGFTPAGLGGNLPFFAAGEADLDLPQIITYAVAHDFSDRLSVMGHVMWFGWESYKRIHVELDSGASLIDPQDYENTVAAALGFEYWLHNDWTVRGGLQYDETPTTGSNRTTRTPDGDRLWVSGGATYDVSDHISLDLAASYIFIDDGHVDRTAAFNDLYGLFGAAGAAASINTRGTTKSNVGILGLALNYKFEP